MKTSYGAEEKELLRKIGFRIRELRLNAGLSQEKLSFKCKLDRTYVGSVERGERNVSLINLNKIALALGVPMPNLIDLQDEQSF
jgi:transcriptional regulator with XRE-family HTH domain